MEQWEYILWSYGAPSNIFGMSWSDVCDPDVFIQHQHLTRANALVAECNQILTPMLQHLVYSLLRRLKAATIEKGVKLPTNTLDFRRNVG